jgi:zinc transport system permease protein
MLDLIQMPFMQRALIAGVLVALLSSYYGVFVVQRGLSFLGDGLAHAAFGGVALGLLLGLEPLHVAIPFTVVVAIGIVWVQQRTQLGSDTAIGVFFSVAMALGVVFIALKTDYAADAMTYLFGSILAVTRNDLFIMAGVALASLGTLPLWGRWAYASFDRELAQADRQPVGREDYILAIALAITTVVAVKLVGIVLIAAFLVIPAATARLLVRTFAGMTLVSIGLGLLSVVLGLYASFMWNLPSGPMIILAQATLFGAALVVRRGK